MYCISCEYRLSGLEAGRCPECGRAFDPADSSTFDRRRRGPQALLGIGSALLIGGLSFFGLQQTILMKGLQSQFTAFWIVAGVGLAAGVAAAVLAAWNRSWLGRIPLLLVGIVAVWAGLAFGHDKYYRVWQALPDAPDEAYADSGPVATLLAGWIPGGIFVVGVFLPALLVFSWKRKQRRSLAPPLPTAPPPPTPLAPPTVPPDAPS